MVDRIERAESERRHSLADLLSKSRSRLESEKLELLIEVSEARSLPQRQRNRRLLEIEDRRRLLKLDEIGLRDCEKAIARK